MLMSGVEFYLDNNSIPTDSSGHLLITDISFFNGTLNASDEEALICRPSKSISRLRTPPRSSDWYLDPEVVETTTTLVGGRRISGDNDRGWTRNRGRVILNGVFYRVVRLKRVSEKALEGKFTCHVLNDTNNNKSLLILYPSE